MSDNVRITAFFDDSKAISEIDRLKAALRGVSDEQTKLSRTTFDAFSRSQIGPQIAALEEMRGAIRKNIAELEVMQRTVGGQTDLRGTINSLLGLDQTIKSASASAKILGSSIASAAAEDSRIRDATVSTTAAIRARTEATNASTLAENARIAALLVADAATFRGYGGGGAAASLGRATGGITGDVLISASAIASVESLTSKINGLKAAIATLGRDAQGFGPLLKQQLASAETALAGRATIPASVISHITERNASELARVQKIALERAGAAVVTWRVPGAGINPADAEAAFAKLKDVSDKTGEALIGNWGQVWRHLIAIVDGALRGQRGQVAASFNALIRDANISTTALTSLGSVWLGVGVTGVAALGALGIAAYETYQRVASIRNAAGELALKGFGTGAVQFEQLGAEFDRLKESGNEWSRVTREIQGEFSKLDPAARSSRAALAELAKGIAGLTSGDQVKILDELVKSVNKSPEAFAKLVAELLGLQSHLTPTGQSLEQLARSTTSTAEALRLVIDEVRRTRGGMVDLGAESHKARNDLLSLSMAVAASDDQVGSFNPTMELFVKTLNKAIEPTKTLETSATNLTEALQRQQDAIKLGNEALSKRVELYERMIDAQQAVTRTTGTPQAEAAKTAAATIEAQVLGAPQDPAETRRHQIAMEDIRGEAEARRADLVAQEDATRARLGETRRTETQRLIGVGMDPETAAQRANESAEVIKANEDVLEATRRVEDQRVRLTVAASRARIAEEQVGAAERVAEQNKIIATLEHEVAIGRGSAEELAAARVQLGTIIRQGNNRTFQEARDNARAEVEIAESSVALINSAYKNLLKTAKETGQLPATFAQINREWLRDLKSAQAQAFAVTQSYQSSLERLDNLRLNSAKAALQTEVASKQISKAQAEQLEVGLTTSTMAEQQRRTQALINADNTTAAQKEKLYEHLALLYEKDAGHQLEAQKRITQAIESENAKHIKSFTNFFDQVGSSFESLIGQAINKTATKADALKQFGQSIILSVVKEIGTQASDYAGRKLGPSLGLTDEQSKGGLGSVLGTALFRAPGFEKEVPKDALIGVADKMSLAVGAQEEAAKLQKKASENLNKASENLNKASESVNKATPDVKKAVPDVKEPVKGGGSSSSEIPPIGAGGDYSEVSKVIRNGYSTDAALALIAKYESSGGQNIKNPKSSASGPWQLLDPTWRGQPESAGYAHAMDAPIELQRQVAARLFEQGGFSSWAPYNLKLTAAIRRGEGQDGSIALKTSVDQLSTKVGTQTGIDQQGIGIDQSSNSITQQLNSDINSDKQATQDQKQAATDNTQAVRQLTTKLKQSEGEFKSGNSGIKPVGKSDDSSDLESGDWSPRPKTALGDNSTKNQVSGMQLFTQGVGLAASAAALFGNRLSTTARTILGAVGVISQLSSFAKNLGSVFDTTAAVTKTVSAATTIEQTAKTANAASFFTDTAAVQANAAAQGASAAGGGIGSIFKAIPLIGGLFGLEHGGIIPSAAGGMLAGGGTLSILHPREMVLPSHLSTGLQNMINSGNQGGGGGTANLTYTANVTGYHPYESRSSFESMLRTHGSSMMNWVENEARNNRMFRR